MARPIETYKVFTARIFSEDDLLLVTYRGTLPTVRKQCAAHFLNFDSPAVIRRQLDKSPAYAKAYQPFDDMSLGGTPCFVHLSEAK